ncbi:MAG: glycosyltransferase family 39 protein [Methanobrevibacter sp.]|jgi:4-amino-4-deoxy-L-arabinose transferase-like glycosyltransferase|nr:glycosyltransferase family 39 protein [Candidatus Methanoflexus mossambicus]
MFKIKFDKDNKLNEEKLSLIFLTSFSTIVALIIIYINCTTNFNTWVDVYQYLMYSLQFTGMDAVDIKLLPVISPLIPFLNSIIFRLGIVSEDSIFVISGLFYIIGVLSSYFLFKIRFKNLIATFGAVLFGGFYIILIETGNGGFDVPGIALTILALYLIINNGNIKNNTTNYKNKSNNKDNYKNNENNENNYKNNTKYFYLGFIVLGLAFLAKFTSLLIFLVIFIYFLSKTDLIENFKKYLKMMVSGLILFALTTLPYIIYLLYNHIPIGFLGYAEAMGLGIKKEFTYQMFYYFDRIPFIISYHPDLNPLSWTISTIFITILILGVLFAIYKLLNNFLSNKNNKTIEKVNNKIIDNNKNNKNNKIYNVLLIISPILMGFSFLMSYFLSWKYNELIFFIAILIFTFGYNKLHKESKFFNYNITIISWFFVYLIFFTTRITKVDRYFIAFLPPFIFICLYFIDIFSTELNSLANNVLNKKESNSNQNKLNKSNEVNKSNKITKSNKVNIKSNKLIKHLNFEKIIPIFIILLFLISTVSILNINKHSTIADNVKDGSYWLKDYDPNYNDKVIMADKPFYAFFLEKKILLLFRDKHSNNLSDKLINKNVTYYISFNSSSISNYKLIKDFGTVYIFKKI